MKMWNIIPNSIKELHLLFKNNQKDLFLVGGSVRDFLMEKEPKDFDLATNATPTEVLEIVKGYRTKLQGEAFNVVVVFTPDNTKGYEIATFREDIYGEKLGKTRNPDVILSTIDKDVFRRDITYNALFFNLEKKEIIDLVGGAKDLQNKITRFVGDPKLRIMEDPLRILRALRFSCRFGFIIDIDSRLAITANVGYLSIITKERIWTEIKNAFDQAKSSVLFHIFFTDFVGFGIAKEYLNGLNINNKFACDVQRASSLELYFANLLKDVEETHNLGKILKDKFQMEKDFSRKVQFLVQMYRNGIHAESIEDWYKNSRGISHETIEEWYDLCGINTRESKAFLKYNPVANATVLMSQGFIHKKLGAKIKEIETEHFKQLIENEKT